MHNSEGLQSEEFLRQFEVEAASRSLTRVFESGSQNVALPDSAKYCNQSNNVLIACLAANPERVQITVARGRSISEAAKEHCSLPGATKTAYSWFKDGWLTPAGAKLDSKKLAIKVIDDAL